MSKVDEDALLNAAVRSSESSSSEQALFYGYGFLMALLPTCAGLSSSHPPPPSLAAP